MCESDATWISCAVMRTRLPDLRTLPSSTVATLSFCATVGMSTSLPLKENADVRDATRRPRIFASTFIVAVTHLDCARVKRHAHAELRPFGPRFAMQRPLRLERRGKRIGRRVERRAEGVATRLEDVTVVIGDAVAQQRIVARERGAHRLGVRFPEPRAALDVGEEQRDGAGRNVCHRVLPSGLGRTPRMIPGPGGGASMPGLAGPVCCGNQSPEGVAWPALQTHRREPT